MTEVLKLSDRHFKMVMIKMLQQIIMNPLETNRIFGSVSDRFRKEREDTKQNQMEILEPKNERNKNFGDQIQQQYIGNS